jgi:hypothetical protein
MDSAAHPQERDAGEDLLGQNFEGTGKFLIDRRASLSDLFWSRKLHLPLVKGRLKGWANSSPGYDLGASGCRPLHGYNLT